MIIKRLLCWIVVPVATAASTFVAPAVAQQKPAAARSGPELLASIRQHGIHGGLVRILAQRDSAHPPAVLGLIGDSLAAIAIAREPGSQAPGPVDALSMLVTSSAHPGPNGVAYAGAFERILRIHHQANDPIMRILALGALLDLQDFERGIPYVRDFLTSNGTLAAQGVGQVIMRATDPGRPSSQAAEALLRELWDEGSVKDREAQRTLRFYATAKGWRQ